MGYESCCFKVIMGLKQIMYNTFGNSRQGSLNADRSTTVALQSSLEKCKEQIFAS